MAAHLAAFDAPDIFCHETWDHVGAWILYTSSPVRFLMESDAEIWELPRHKPKTTTVGRRFASKKLFVAGNVGHQICSYVPKKLSKNLEVLFEVARFVKNKLVQKIDLHKLFGFIVGRVRFLSWDCCSSRVKGRMTEGLNGRCVVQWEFQDDSELSIFVESFERKEAKKLNIFGR